MNDDGEGKVLYANDRSQVTSFVTQRDVERLPVAPVGHTATQLDEERNSGYGQSVDLQN